MEDYREKPMEERPFPGQMPEDGEPQGHPRGHGHGHHGGDDPHGYRRCSGGRVCAFYLTAALLNILLAVYLLYAIGLVMEYDWTTLQGGATRSIVQAVFEVLLLLSPVILTVLLNRIVFRLFRGRRRFPRGTALLMLALILIVQAGTVLLVLSQGFIGGTNGFNIETVSSAILPS